MSVVTPQLTLSLEGELCTNAKGIEKIMCLYHRASQYRNTRIFLDFYKMTWMDANLASLMYAITHSLYANYGVILTTDYPFLYQKFNILFRNGWLKTQGLTLNDIQQTTVPCREFKQNQEPQFLQYLKKELLQHRGMASLKENVRHRIQADISEIFQNTFRHAQTGDPFFVCGQYFPNKKSLILTMVDLGVGFLKPIQAYTTEYYPRPITTSTEAIKWAIKDGTSTQNTSDAQFISGGGLLDIHQYCNDTKGCFQIYSGNGFFGTDVTSTADNCLQMPYHFDGSIVNLTFRLGE